MSGRTARGLVALWLVADVPACRREVATAVDAGAARPAPVAPGDAGVAASARDAMAPSGSARVVFQGRAQGRGVEPPIREYVNRAMAEPWTGEGEARLDVPEGQGAVSGTVQLGDLTLTVRGVRDGARVRATLDQFVPPGDGGPPEDVFRGTLDAEIAGTSLRGTWEISSQAGVRRRSGSLEARR